MLSSNEIICKEDLEEKFPKVQLQKNSSQTYIKPFEFSFHWSIHNFSLIKRNTGQFISSAPFTTVTSDSTSVLKWRLHLYPREKQDIPKIGIANTNYTNNPLFGLQHPPTRPLTQTMQRNEGPEQYLVIKLVLISGKIDDPIDFTINILNKNNEKKSTISFTQGFVTLGNGHGGTIIKRVELLNTDNGLLPNDTLTILCEGKGYVLIDSEVDPGFFYPAEQNFNLGNDLGMFLGNGELCDVTITVSDGETKAHILILAARSPVFKAMFLHETKEREKNHVEIPDVTMDVFQELLNFIYTGKSPNLKAMACGLFVAADKYAIMELKAMCEKSLCVNLSVENSIGMLKFADLHAPGNLKIKTLNFIKNHAEEVMKLGEWSSLASTHPHLLAELCQALAKSFDRI